ncbi:hypothetical protein BN59_02942 [Legionella massiliensis]|uniref:Uncharacterized protein n=1 Tax=Legionella massiliensis TaxID=1034943 RepID=A0A078KW02_9GAMM|nr:hypothetical protein [Legionella massiliensis]CDZ78630.1 hypothetical protein BN59_02942 [Legionella massiliensis]CEE14368.1 hypothetical protein BN1094_02942 [Legionella massiliensis]
MNPSLFEKKCTELNNSKLLARAGNQYTSLLNLFANNLSATEQELQEFKNAWNWYAHMIIAHVREVQRSLPWGCLDRDQKQIVDDYLAGLKATLQEKKNIVMSQIEEKRWIANSVVPQNFKVESNFPGLDQEPSLPFDPWWPEVLATDLTFADLLQSANTFTDEAGVTNTTFSY